MSSISIEPAEDKFGVKGSEALQGFKDMPLANPAPNAEPQGDVFGSDYSGIEQAADELSKSRQEGEKPVEVERYYQHIGGAKDGEHRPEKEVVSAEQAAWDLTNAREADAMARQAAEKNEINAAIEQLRAGDQEQQTPIPEPQQPIIEQQQPVQEPPNAQLEGDEVARALQNPAVLNAVQQHIAQQTAQAEQAAQTYRDAAITAADSALIGLAMAYPELQGLNAAQFPTALAVIAKSSPQRAQNIIDHIGMIDNTLRRANEARQAETQRYAALYQQHQQHQQQQFHTWASQHDQAFDSWTKRQGATDEERRAVLNEVMSMFREGGWTDETIAHEYNSSSAIRSLAGQQVLWHAAKQRIGERRYADARKNKLDRTAPCVQRPVGNAEFVPEADNYLRQLEKPGKTLSAKEAAAFVNARRSAQRR